MSNKTTSSQASSTSHAASGIRHTRADRILRGGFRSPMGRASFQGVARNIPNRTRNLTTQFRRPYSTLMPIYGMSHDPSPISTWPSLLRMEPKASLTRHLGINGSWQRRGLLLLERRGTCAMCRITYGQTGVDEDI
jgi:hypothetical protein